MFIFFIVGLVSFAVFCVLIVKSSGQSANDPSLNIHKAQFMMLVDWLFPIGLPILALILSVCGWLPGTHGSKQGKGKGSVNGIGI
jgi:hypothetical protein